MAGQTLYQRIALQGGEQIKKEFVDLGRSGQDAFKQIKTAADAFAIKPAGLAQFEAELKKLGPAGDQVFQKIYAAARGKIPVDGIRAFEVELRKLGPTGEAVFRRLQASAQSAGGLSTSGIQRYRQELERLGPQGAQVFERIRQASSFTLNTAGVERFRRELEQLGPQGAAVFARLKSEAANLTVNPAFGQGFVTVKSQIDAAMGSLRNFGNEMRNIGSQMSIGLTAPIALAGRSLLQMAGDFEAAMNSLKVATGATAEEFTKLEELARKIGRETSFGPQQAAKAMEELAKVGVPTRDILSGAAEAAVTLAEATGSDLAPAATLLADVMQQFKLKVSDLPMIIDQITGAINESKLDFTGYATAVGQAGSVVSGIGKASFQDFNAMLAKSAAGFTSGSDAGTSFKTMILKLVSPSKEGAAALKELGVEVFDANGKTKPLIQTIEELSKAIEGMTEKDVADKLGDAFGVDAIRSVIELSREGAAGIERMKKAIGDTKAIEAAKVRMEGYNGVIKQLKGAWEDLAISFGKSGLLKGFTDLVGVLEKGVTAVGNFAPGVLYLIGVLAGLAAIAGPAAFLIGSLALAFAKIAGGLAWVARLAGLTGTLAAVGGAATGTATAVTSLGTAFGVLLGVFSRFFWPAALATLVATNWKEIGAAISTVTKGIRDDLADIPKLLQQVFSGDFAGAGQTLTASWERMLAEMKRMVERDVNDIRGLFRALGFDISNEDIKINWDNIVTDLEPVLEGIRTKWDATKDYMRQAVQNLGDLWTNSGMEAAFESVMQGIRDKWDATTDYLSKGWQNIKNALQQSGIADAFSQITDGIRQKWDAGIDHLSQGWNNVSSAASTAVDAINGAVDRYTTRVGSAKSATDALVGAMQIGGTEKWTPAIQGANQLKTAANAAANAIIRVTSFGGGEGKTQAFDAMGRKIDETKGKAAELGRELAKVTSTGPGGAEKTFDVIREGVTKAATAAREAGAAFDEFFGKIKFGEGAREGVAQLATEFGKVPSMIQNGLGGMDQVIDKNVQTGTRKLSELPKETQDFARDAQPGLDAFGQAVEGKIDAITQSAGRKFGLMWEQFRPSENVVDRRDNPLEQMLTEMLQGAEDAAEQITNVLSSVKPDFSAINTAFTTASTMLVQTATQIGTQVLQGIATGFLAILGANPFQALVTAAQTILPSITQVFQQLPGQISQVLQGVDGSSIFQGIEEAAQQAAQSIAQAFAQVQIDWSQMTSGADAAFGQLPGIAANAAAAMVGAFNGFAGQISAVFASVVSSVQSQMAQLAASVEALVSQMAAALAELEAAIASAQATLAASGGGGGGAEMATGGAVRGPGTGTSDSIPAWLSNGEFVIRASAVRKYGYALLSAINNKRFKGSGGARKFAAGGMVNFKQGLPAFADGGLVGALSAITSSLVQGMGASSMKLALPSGGGGPALAPVNVFLPSGGSPVQLFGTQDAVGDLMRAASAAKMASAGRKPRWQT